MIAYRQLLDLLRIHQQRSHFVECAYSSELSLTEMYVLIEIDMDPQLTVRGLQPLLMLDHGTVSRAYYRLLRNGYVISHRDPNNKRKRILETTQKAREILELHDREDDEFLRVHLGRLSASEVSELQRCFHLIGDATHVPRLVLRKTEHPFQEGMRRTTRGIGLTGPSLFGTSSSSTVWQLLAAIRDLAPKATLSGLIELFGIKASTLSQQLSRFEDNGWIRRDVDQDDSRVRTLMITEKGFGMLEEIYREGERILAKAFRLEPPHVLDNLVMIFMKLFGILGGQQITSTTKSAQCLPIKSAEERKVARAYLILHLIRTGKYLDASEVLIGDSHENFVFRIGERLASVAELGRSSNGWELLNCGWDDLKQDENLLLEFMNEIALNLIASGEGSKVYVRRELLPESVIAKLASSIHMNKFLEIR